VSWWGRRAPAGPARADAERWCRPAASRSGAALIDPAAGRVNFGNYAATWIEERPGLRPKTVELYRYLLRSHLAPTFATALVADIHEPHVRRWRKERLDAGASGVTVAKAYRLLKAILNTAADDGLIRRNPHWRSVMNRFCAMVSLLRLGCCYIV
jgi:hypothetical protein